jgi:NADH dehydrogenase [ubiquinone] 1 alpha subcomplex assembly factor 5
MTAIFDRKLLKHNLDRFSKNFSKSDFLFKEISLNLIDNIKDFKQDFNNILEIGAKDGFLGQKISKIKNSKSLVQTNFSNKLNTLNPHNLKIIMDDESLCFKENSFDLILNNLNLHFTNDVLGSLIQSKKLLQEKGLFIGCFFGGTTLKELRDVFNQTELELYNGISPRVIPFIDIKDSGALAQKAGFGNIITDSHIIEISYSSLLKLLKDLKNMALGNILFSRSNRTINKKMLFLMEKLIKQHYPDGDKGFIISFEIITITAF